MSLVRAPARSAQPRAVSVGRHRSLATAKRSLLAHFPHRWCALCAPRTVPLRVVPCENKAFILQRPTKVHFDSRRSD